MPALVSHLVGSPWEVHMSARPAGPDVPGSSPFDPARFADAFVSFLEAVQAEREEAGRGLAEVIAAHLGDAATPRILSEEFDPYEQPSVQAALDAMLASPARSAQLHGIAAPAYMEIDLATILGDASRHGVIGVGPPSFVTFHLAHGRELPCVRRGIYTVSEGAHRLVVAIFGPVEHGPRPQVRVEVMASDAAVGEAFLRELRATVDRENVYRGHVISLSPNQMGMGPQTLVAFHELPPVAREDLILPAGRLELIERQSIGFSQVAETLRASGRPLKRGLLLYGPPGTGKTMTLMYLIGQMPDRTTLLTTGLGVGMLTSVMQMARTLQPAIVVLDDVDLIAQDRFMPHGGGMLLFALLNELDGLREDCDVIFALTTNRPEVLESALTARPGRIDLAVEFPLPDAAGRRRLLQVHARGLDLVDVDLDAVVAGTEGASPAFVKELMRKAALHAAIAGKGTHVHQEDLDRALDELNSDGLTRRLLGLQETMRERVHRDVPWPDSFVPGMSGPMP
jgi:hypothetical protein